MPASVQDALREAFQREGGMSSEEATQMLEAMVKSGRLQSETWSWSVPPQAATAMMAAEYGAHSLPFQSWSGEWSRFIIIWLKVQIYVSSDISILTNF